jgi:tetratricopeptide (TPR) repeat protein
MLRRIATAAILAAVPALITQHAAAQTSEHDAIKAVIRAETESWLKRDAAGWEATWLHDADVTRTLVYGLNHTSVVGWDNFGPRVVESIKRRPEPIPFGFTNENYLIHAGDTIAWVEYDQSMTSPREPQVKRSSRERRALKKRDGRWKIIAQITIDPESLGSGSRAVEMRLNTEGYRLLQAKKVPEAIELLSLNARLNPDSWNVYDSLGEAYAAAGQKAQAVEQYEKSLKLNPKNEHATAALAKLKRE